MAMPVVTLQTAWAEAEPSCGDQASKDCAADLSGQGGARSRSGDCGQDVLVAGGVQGDGEPSPSGDYPMACCPVICRLAELPKHPYTIGLRPVTSRWTER